MMPITNWDKELNGLIYKADKDYERLAKANVATAAKIPGGAKAGTTGAKPPTGTPSTAKGTPATAKDTKPADSTAKKTNTALETPVKGLEVTKQSSAASKTSKQAGQTSPRRNYATGPPETEGLTYYQDASNNAEASRELVGYEIEILRDQSKLKKQQAFEKPLKDEKARLTAEKTKLQTDLTTEQTAVHTSKSNFEKEITTFEKDELSYLQNLLTFETKVKKQSAIPASYGVTGLNGAISDQ